jgi:hypothetical protein
VDITAVIVALLGTVGVIGAAYLAARNGKIGGLSRIESAASWKEQYELEHAKAEAWKEKYEAEVVKRKFAESEADACDRRLNAVYAELRRTGQLTDRRQTPRDEAS